SMLGVMPAFSQASRPLSHASLTSATGHMGRGWPSCMDNSFSEKNSIIRDVVKALRSKAGLLLVRSFPSLGAGSVAESAPSPLVLPLFAIQLPSHRSLHEKNRRQPGHRHFPASSVPGVPVRPHVPILPQMSLRKQTRLRSPRSPRCLALDGGCGADT